MRVSGRELDTRGPLPAARLLVTDGLNPTPESGGPWLGAGALTVGLGSALFALPEEAWPRRLRDLLNFTRRVSR